MRAFTISVAAAFFVLVQTAAAASPKATADFYWQEGYCSNENRGMTTSLFESGNATVASDSAYYAIGWAQYDPACTVDYHLDYTRIKWHNQKNNERRDIVALSADTVDPKDLHVIRWGQEEVAPVHPIARRQGSVVVRYCDSVSWKDEGIVAINLIKVTGC